MEPRPFDRAMDNDMTSLLRRIAFTLAAALGFALPASASTFSVDYSDLWYIPAENGWGLNLIQQNNVLFATMFVYGSDGTPRWYVASDLESSNGTNFSGVLYKTTGPYFGAAWNSSYTPTAAGTMTIVFNSPTSASLTYVVDGITVGKTLQRQTWKGENLSGTYVGGLAANASSCNTVANGKIYITGGGMSVAHNAASQAVTITLPSTTNTGASSICTFNGTYGQQGKLGSIAGTWSCVINGAPYNNGTFTMSELQSTVRGFNAKFQGQDQFCQYNGNFGVVLDPQ
jgi:hypothetical protein